MTKPFIKHLIFRLYISFNLSLVSIQLAKITINNQLTKKFSFKINDEI